MKHLKIELQTLPSPRSVKVTPPDYQKEVDEASSIKSINLHQLSTKEIIGTLHFQNGSLVFTDTSGLEFTGVDCILRHNATFIIKPKRLADDICEFLGLELQSDKAQWILYQVEANRNILKRNPFKISIKEKYLSSTLNCLYLPYKPLK